MRRRTPITVGLVAAASLLTACGATSTSTTTPATPAPATPAPTAATDAAPPTFPTGTDQQFARNKGPWDLVLRDVRVGSHDGFDRVVLVYRGTGTPGWGAEYVKRPRAEGSGEAVDVRGDHYLGVSISGVTIRAGYPETPADLYRGPRHFAPESADAVEDLDVGGAYEGYSQLFLGIEGDEVPFRVFALTNPSRLVVDVKDEVSPRP